MKENSGLFPWQRSSMIRHSQRLLSSFQHWTGQPLLAVEGTPEAIAQALFEAPFVVVSHGTEPDPILNYGNQTALQLWQMDWEQLTNTPSRHTAEPIEQAERAQLLAQAQSKGYISNYQGIRITSTGRRFYIKDVIIWDVLDETQTRCGQAATFSDWQFLDT
jgi:hypothetical protein